MGAVALAPVAITVWLALRKNSRADDDQLLKLLEQLDSSARATFDRLLGEIARLSQRCDQLDTELEEIHARLRAEQDRIHRLRRDRNDLRQRITALHAQLHLEAPVWPPTLPPEPRHDP